MYKVVIWGCGSMGAAWYRAFDKEKCEVVFCDTNSLGYTVIDGVKCSVMFPERLKEYAFDYLFISSEKHKKEIVAQIRKMNLDMGRVFAAGMGLDKLGRIMDLFTEKGYQYVNTLRLSSEISDIKAKVSELADLQELLQRCISAQTALYGGGVLNIGIVNLDAIHNVPERIISRCSRFLIADVMEEMGVCDFAFTEIDMLHPDYNQLIGCRLIFFAGGGIIKLDSYRMDFPRYIDRITMLADAYDIPVMFIGAGVEECNDPAKYAVMKNALNRNCVKSITVRENYPAIRKYVYNTKTRLVQVADSALYAKEAYGLSGSRRQNKIVGIGTVNFINWEREGYPVAEERLLDFYNDLILELEERGYGWKIFTNGGLRDFAFGQKICSRSERYQEHLIPRPGDEKEWLDTLCGFSGVIAPRLHTNIVSCSLGIPCVGLVWNKKVKFFAEAVGKEEYAFEPENFDAVRVVDSLIKQEANMPAEEALQQYRQSTRIEIREFLRTYL